MDGVYLQEYFAAFIWGVKSVRSGGCGYLQECFAAFIWGVKRVQRWGRLLKFSRLIFCGPGVFILKVEKS